MHIKSYKFGTLDVSFSFLTKYLIDLFGGSWIFNIDIGYKFQEKRFR